jgi:hypothetical protein
MNRALALLLFSLMLASCGGYTETIQKAEKGYLKFVGNTAETTITIDDGSAFSYNPEIELYQVRPGRHIVKVFRNNQVIVNRIIIVENEITTEIIVP